MQASTVMRLAPRLPVVSGLVALCCGAFGACATSEDPIGLQDGNPGGAARDGGSEGIVLPGRDAAPLDGGHDAHRPDVDGALDDGSVDDGGLDAGEDAMLEAGGDAGPTTAL